MNHIAIIGSGPAGLLAAYAVKTMGGTPYIYSPAVPDVRFSGAQYLHRSIPGLTEKYADKVIKIFLRGSELVYTEKVYRGNQGVLSSWGQFGHLQPAWDISKRMVQLCEMLIPDHHHHAAIDPHVLQQMCHEYSGVICTAPAKFMCLSSDHIFPSMMVHITDGAQPGVNPNSMVYSGLIEDEWYRSSLVFGVGSTEWPLGSSVSSYGAKKIEKPLETTCDCHLWRDNYRRAGRYGKWKKGVLSHDGYEVAEQMMRRLAHEGRTGSGNR